MGAAPLVRRSSPVPAIRVAGFCKRYRRQVAVRQVDLAVQPGEIFGLIGPDGAGKSSLMKAVAGVLSYEGGSVEVLGVPVDSEAAAERIKARIGFMPQGLGLNLYPDLSVDENIDFFARLRQVPRDWLAERKQRLLAMTRLAPFRARAMKHLSGGMKQKLGLVCTLIHQPELVILDEPTTGVDPVSRRDFWAILAELLREQGITALVSTAYLDEAARFHRLALMFQGRVLAEGEPEQILEQVPGVSVEVEARPQLEALNRLRPQVPQLETVGPVVRVFLESGDAETARNQVRQWLRGLEIKRIDARKPELEDAFVALLRRRRLADVTTLGEPPASTFPARSGDGVAIEARDLTRDFGAFRAVDHVSFRVQSGEIFGLLGANGAGKTTVIKMLTGILPPTAGHGQVAGADMRHAGRLIRERIGYMSQAFSLYLDLTVLENIRLYARIYAVPPRQRKARIHWILALAGLQGVEGRLTGQLPMGLRQRLALGCALVHRPRVLFLDEPTSGVDPLGRRRFWEILVRMARQQGVAILVTTHYMNEAEHCDHLALMYAGRIIADASPDRLKQALQDEAGPLLEISTDRPLEALKRLEQAGFEGGTLFGRRIHLLSRAPEQTRRRIQALLAEAGITLEAVERRAPSLEDVFVYRIGQQEQEAAS